MALLQPVMAMKVKTEKWKSPGTRSWHHHDQDSIKDIHLKYAYKAFILATDSAIPLVFMGCTDTVFSK